MTETIYSRPGVVEAIDVHGRPFGVPMPGITPVPDSQQVLKAEAERPDATDREQPAMSTRPTAGAGVGTWGAAEPRCVIPGRDTCTGACETTVGCDCWPNHVDAVPMREPDPPVDRDLQRVIAWSLVGFWGVLIWWVLS